MLFILFAYSCLREGCLNGSVLTLKTNGNRTKVQDVGYGWAGRSSRLAYGPKWPGKPVATPTQAGSLCYTNPVAW
jgi:hypothetical protein